MSEIITYEVLGEGEPLLFMHGLGADRRQTTSALADLPGVQVIAPDFRAHGDSIYCNEGLLGFDQFADDVIAILDELGLEKVHVGGLSMGSGVSLNLALRYPERVRKLILLRPSWLDSQEPEHLRLVADAGFLIERHGLESGESALEEMAGYQSLLGENEKVAKSINGVFGRPQALDAASVLCAMWQDRPFAHLEDLNSVTNEALVLYTTRDELHPIEVAEAIHHALPNSSMAELAPRYYDNARYTAELREAVLQFLNLN